MRRAEDLFYCTYTVRSIMQSGACIEVKCPQCGGHGAVTLNTAKKQVRFSCLHCGCQLRQELKVKTGCVHNICQHCRRHYRIGLKTVPPYKVINVTCLHCGHTMPGTVNISSAPAQLGHKIVRGREPFFGLELWFVTALQGQLVWALNREHLNWMIEFIGASLRVRPCGCNNLPAPLKTQSDHMPAFIKSARNRQRLVQLLTRLQQS